MVSLFIFNKVTQFFFTKISLCHAFFTVTMIGHISPPGHSLTDPLSPTPCVYLLLMESVKSRVIIHLMFYFVFQQITIKVFLLNMSPHSMLLETHHSPCPIPRLLFLIVCMIEFFADCIMIPGVHIEDGIMYLFICLVNYYVVCHDNWLSWRIIVVIIMKISWIRRKI